MLNLYYNKAQPQACIKMLNRNSINDIFLKSNLLDQLNPKGQIITAIYRVYVTVPVLTQSYVKFTYHFNKYD